MKRRTRVSRLVRSIPIGLTLVLSSAQTANGQTPGPATVSYSFDFHDCNSPYNEADQPGLRDITSRFTATNVGCHSSAESFGTREWPEEATIDPDKYVGFHLVAPDGFEISLADTDTLWFEVYGGSALEVFLHDASGDEIQLYERARTGNFGPDLIPAPIPTATASSEFEFRIHAYDPPGFVVFDSVELTFQVVESINVEEFAAGRADECVVQGTFPNPTAGTVQTRISAFTDGVNKMRLINAVGKPVRSWAIANDPSGRATLFWDTTGLSAGVYLLELACNGNRSTKLVSVL